MIKIKLSKTEDEKLTAAAINEKDTLKEYLSAQEKYIAAKQHRVDLFDMVLASHKIDPAIIVPDSTTNLIDGILHIPEIPQQVEIQKPAKAKKKK
jgi:hypothetical protein